MKANQRYHHTCSMFKMIQLYIFLNNDFLVMRAMFFLIKQKPKIVGYAGALLLKKTCPEKLMLIWWVSRMWFRSQFCHIFIHYNSTRPKGLGRAFQDIAEQGERDYIDFESCCSYLDFQHLYIVCSFYGYVRH